MEPRRCKRCGDGLVVERVDQYGAYLVCMSCGDTTYPGLGAPRGPGEEPERNGLSDAARQVKTWRGTLYNRAGNFPAPARCVWPDCHYCGEGKGCCAKPAAGLAYRTVWGAAVPTWAEMRLRTPYGVAEVDYSVEPPGASLHKGKAWAERSVIPEPIDRCALCEGRSRSDSTPKPDGLSSGGLTPSKWLGRAPGKYLPRFVQGVAVQG